MLKKTIKYVDYNGNEKEEDFYFHLSKVELTKMEANHEGGMKNFLTDIINANDGGTIIKLIEELILTSYGKKCQDGSFEKSPELSKKFSQTVAYETLFMELVTNSEAAAEFANNIIPQDLYEQAKKELDKKDKQ